MIISVKSNPFLYSNMNRFNRHKNNAFGGQKITGIAESLKINVIDKLNQFMKDDNQRGIHLKVFLNQNINYFLYSLKVLKFDPNLTSNERKYIHNYCANKTSLKTKSFGFYSYVSTHELNVLCFGQ